MFLYDSVADAQAKSSAFADRLCSVEGIENPGRILKPRTVIVELYADIGILSEDANLQNAASAGFDHGVKRVIDDVQKDLLKLMRIGDNRWNVVGEFAFQWNVVDS